MSFLGLEGLHVFCTGAAGGIGSQVVKEFLGMSFTGAYIWRKVVSFGANQLEEDMLFEYEFLQS